MAFDPAVRSSHYDVAMVPYVVPPEPKEVVLCWILTVASEPVLF